MGEPPSSLAGAVPPQRGAGLASRSVVSEPDSAVGSSVVEGPPAGAAQGGVMGPAGAVDTSLVGPAGKTHLGCLGPLGMTGVPGCIAHPLMLPNLPEGTPLPGSVEAPQTGDVVADVNGGAHKVIAHVQVHSQPEERSLTAHPGPTATC